ncbi:hypothetical protein [Massilia eurypsychrophila]|jgi:hypothetical protein|uniref:hypothetical protein n=1 Tax=Massilia eurypsychrophila TaxID=1485217 RepID=UPI001033B275|nr:hypothetical protein [Massilia eurypsychrophila]
MFTPTTPRHDLSDLVRLRSEINSALAGKVSEEVSGGLLADFTRGYGAPQIFESYKNIWLRAQKLEAGKRIVNVHKLIYRGGGSERYGRASRPKSEVLYAAWDEKVALDEIKVVEGDIVQIISLRVAGSNEASEGIVNAMRQGSQAGVPLKL